MKKLFTLIGFIQLAILVPIFGQIPGTINVQGVLTNASGQIVANGNYSITFRLYASAQDATVLWEEKQDNLSVQAGVFSASLGKIKPFTVPFDKTYFLGLQIGQESELAPRIEMTSTPYSMMAKTVENNSITAAKIQNNTVTADKIVPPIISSLNGIINDGGDLKLKAGKNIEVTPDPNDKSISISVTGLDTVSNDVRYVNENQINVIGQTMIKDNAVSVEKIIPNVVSSINNVNNDGGNINIVAGANITILNNDQENTITISAVNPGNTNPGIGKINAGKGIAVAGTDGPTAVISVSPNSLTDLEVADKSLSAISLADGAVGNPEIQPNAVTVDKIAPNVVSSLSGVSNDGGNINLVAGNNVTIVPNDVNKTITISASGTGGGTSNFTQLIEGNGIGIQNPFGPNTTIGLKPNILLGPAGSLHVLNQNSGAVAGISTNNQGGFLTLSNVQGTQTFGVSNFSDLQPSLFLNSRLGRQVLEMKANEFSDGEINLKSVLSNTVIRLTSNDNAGGLINVFNSIGNIAAQLRSDVDNDGTLFINSSNNVRVLDLSTNVNGGGYLGLFNEVGTEAVRLTSRETRGGRINVYNQLENLATYISTNSLGDGGLFINSGENFPIIDLLANEENGSGFFGLYNSDATSVIEMSAYNDRQPFIHLYNRLNNKVAELNANEFSDGTLNLFSVLTNPTLQLTSNPNAGGLINVFNQAGLLTAQLTELEDGGFLALSNLDETEMIQLGILPDRNARIRVNNRLGKRAADLISNEFSDGQLTLFSVLENPTVLVGANEDAGGLVTVLHKGGTPSAIMTERNGFGGVGVFSPTQAPLAAMLGKVTDGFGTFVVYHKDENSIMAEMTRDANENGALGIFNRNQIPIVRLGGNSNSDGQVGVWNVNGGKTAELIRDPVALGGKLSIFNKDANLAANVTAGANGSGLLQLYNNLKNLSAGFLADDNGGQLFISNGTPSLSPRVDLSNTQNGGQLFLYSKESNLMDQLGVRANGEGYLQIASKRNYPNPAVLLTANDTTSEGLLNLFNNQNIPVVLLGTRGSHGAMNLLNKPGISSMRLYTFETGGSITITDGVSANNTRAILENINSGGRLSLSNKDSKPVSQFQSGSNSEGLWRILSKTDSTKNRLEMGGDNAGTGYLKMYNSLNNNTSFLGHDVLGNGSMEMRSNLGTLGGFFTAYTDGGRLAITDGSASNNYRGLLENALNGGKFSIYNKSNIPVDDITVANNGEGLIRIAARPDFSKSRLELGGDDAGAGFLRLFNGALKKTAELFTNGTMGGELDIFNANAVNTSRLGHSTNGSGLLEIGTPNGNKVVRVTSSDGTGFIGVDNIDNLEVVRITANTGKGGGMALRNDKAFDMIKLTQDQSYGTILVNNATGGVLTNITRNTANGGFVGTKDQNGKDAIWLTTGATGGGHFNTFNSLGNAALTLNSNASNIGNVSVHGSTGNEIARVSGTSNGIGFVGIFNSTGFGLAGLTSNNTTLGGYIYAQTAAGKDVARMTTTSAGGGVIAITGPVGTAAISYLTNNNQNGGYVGVATSAGNDRARITTNTGGSGIVSVSNTSGTDVAEATVSAANHGTVATYNASGNFMAGLLATTSGQGYIRASNSSGNERASMSSGDLGGRVDVSDNSGNVRVIMSAGGNMTVNDLDGSYLSNYSTGSGAYFRIVDKFQHSRAEVKNGVVLAQGPNGIEHSFMSTTNGSNFGYIGVCNSNIVGSPVKAGMYTNNNNQGVLFADIKNFKIDYPGKPDKQIWYGSLEGPELAAYIRGTGKLINGKASIEFTDHYQKLANTGTMTVILTPLSGKSKGLAVVKKAGTGFEVEELLEGSGSYEFDWEVKCVRKGHEGFEVVRNKSDEPKPFTGADLPIQLPDRNQKETQVDELIHEKVIKQ